MPRKKLIAANWKMHKTIGDAEAFASGLKGSVTSLPDCDLALFPPFLALPATAKVLESTRVVVGAQNLFWETQGAYTGEIAAKMIVDAGGTHVIVGHSERRHTIGESNVVVAKKLGAAIDAGLTAVFCVGERLEDREAGEAERYVSEQLVSALSSLAAERMLNVVIAYEPVWAIGTGRTATPDDADGMHRFIRRYVDDRFGENTASSVRILYGGSVKPENAGSLLERPDIDGALIGGASLELDSFLKIAAAAGPPS
jgi:triosephosphate isomerase